MSTPPPSVERIGSGEADQPIVEIVADNGVGSRGSAYPLNTDQRVLIVKGVESHACSEIDVDPERAIFTIIAHLVSQAAAAIDRVRPCPPVKAS